MLLLIFRVMLKLKLISLLWLQPLIWLKFEVNIEMDTADTAAVKDL